MTGAEQGPTEELGSWSARCPPHGTTPAELREQARIFTVISAKEASPETKRAFASAAYALAQLGECIERLNKAE